MPVDQPWWQAFFDHADSLILSRFPDPEETRDQVAALQRLVPLRREDTIELEMSVDEALKYIVSMGVVTPDTRPRGARGPRTQIKAESL